MTIFWDTNLFIYLWEACPYHKETTEFFNWMKRTNQTLVTSAMTLGEILVKPIRENNKDEVEEYRKKFARIEVGTFNPSTAFHYANLRARYKGIKPPDTIQLACAIDLNTDIFISHDKHLSKIKLPVRCIDLATWRELKELPS